ncbi:MAG: SIS domain-containing protein, partial [Acidobacteria bacterium]|nr:SIS domain-containing protein [Acidobacteriota bacterium]
MSYTSQYFAEATEIIRRIDPSIVELTADLLVQVRHQGGRIFFLGVGGGAGHASHAVNDFRTIAGFECYSPSDNVSELTARINDDGWDTCYQKWLQGSRLTARDLIFVFSVG